MFGFVRRKEVERSVRRGRDKRCGVEGLSLHPLLMVMDRRAPLHLALNGRKLVGTGEKSTHSTVPTIHLILFLQHFANM